MDCPNCSAANAVREPSFEGVKVRRDIWFWHFFPLWQLILLAVFVGAESVEIEHQGRRRSAVVARGDVNVVLARVPPVPDGQLVVAGRQSRVGGKRAQTDDGADRDGGGAAGKPAPRGRPATATLWIRKAYTVYENDGFSVRTGG